MIFTSLLFISFLIIVIFVYYLFPKKVRYIPLFMANSIFIISFGISLYIFMFVYSLINYGFLILMNKSKKLLRKIIFICIIFVNIFVLCYFKYLHFILINIDKLFQKSTLSSSITTADFIIPLGISFFTFKTISLIIDKYKKRSKIINLGEYLSYVLFFPQFLSGPIERFSTFVHGLNRQTQFSSINFFSGVERILYGLFKKMVIADSIALFVNTVFTNPSKFFGIDFVIAAYLFSFQLYFDFSGYSDIAIGIAKIIGFNTPENFNLPYLASSIQDFWRRWHISLSSWFRDYLYIPLGGNRKGTFRTYINVLIVFILTGLWHGASWTFIIWGLLHGFYQIITNIYLFLRNYFSIKNNSLVRFEKIIGIILTFHFVTFSWIFFRSNSIRDALFIIKSILQSKLIFGNINFALFYPLLLMTLIILMKKIFLRYKLKQFSIGRIIFSVLILILIIFGANYTSQDFLYFKCQNLI